jgi:hypothetical protein
VHVRVDQPGKDNLARGVDDLDITRGRGCHSIIGLESRDPPATDVD